MASTGQVQRFLVFLETKESELLTWGDTQGFFSQDEFDNLLEEHFPDEDPFDIEQELVNDRAVIVRVTDSSEEEVGYRTRSAEAVHLFRNLRQWFPNQDIAASRTLVSDFRFLRTARNYPRRDLDLESCLAQWRQDSALDNDIEDFLRALVGDQMLAGFQMRATGRIISQHRKKPTVVTGTIVTAGTGSGKTMAFYLPALALIGTELVDDARPRVRAIAIYPRKELLKDQFNEAFKQCRKLDELLTSRGVRKLTIGAFFGDTPNSVSGELKDLGNRSSRPYTLLHCPDEECHGEMRWTKDDLRTDREILRCSECSKTITGEEVCLTREVQKKNPPDILFTTTEMLNQRLSDSSFRGLFRIGDDQKPPLVLLDEVHTYSGTQGAQTAYILRRWIASSKKRPHIVGLSATLADAEGFFSSLTGARTSSVALICAAPNEEEEHGSEYVLALKGDPVSQTALLSTTIQAAMLTHRVLDSKAERKSNGIWGTKTFIFSDNLDITNRLYYQLQDAEGRDQWGNPNARGPLARLRTDNYADLPELKFYGQDWNLCQQIGHPLGNTPEVDIQRTSSQDQGYESTTDVTVASSSLELGFDDAEVGAVIQHKTPNGPASYLQRKGRAGRPRTMHPWMIIVLSDFGKDRITYQQYEKLINPELKLSKLPIENDLVQKIHAAQAVLDWCNHELQIDIWTCLNGAKDHPRPKDLKKLEDFIGQLIQDPEKQAKFKKYLKRALTIFDERTIDRLLWQPPRSIFLEFLPALRSRLRSNWGKWSEAERRVVPWIEFPRSDSNWWGSPIPDFITSNTFDALDSPELEIHLENREESMNFLQGLDEFAPGKVSKRFAVDRDRPYWVAPADYTPAEGDKIIEIDAHEVFGERLDVVAEVVDSETGRFIPILKPQAITPKIKSDPTLSDSSNGRLRWESVFPDQIDLAKSWIPKSTGWQSAIETVHFFTHREMCPIEVVRYSKGSSAQHKFASGAQANVRFDWSKDGAPAGIGTTQIVDAALLRFSISDEKIKKWLSEDAAYKAQVLRPQYFAFLIENHPLFENDWFQARWVTECFLALVVIEHCATNDDLAPCISRVLSGQSVLTLPEIPQWLFQLGQFFTDPNDDETISNSEANSADHSDHSDQRLQRSLRDLFVRDEVIQVLRDTSRALTTLPLHSIEVVKWIRQLLGPTFAGASQLTLTQLIPDVDEKSFNVDAKTSETHPDRLDIWISESESGGTGVIGLFQDLYRDDPMRFFTAFHNALGPSDYEKMDRDLRRVLEHSQAESRVQKALNAVRNASDYRSRLAAHEKLIEEFSALGYFCSHSFLSVLHSRLLRPGSTGKDDESLLAYLTRWDELEDNLKLELPLHLVAFGIAWEEARTEGPIPVFRRLCEVQSRLWTRGITVRKEAVAYFNRFDRNSNQTERLLGEIGFDAGMNKVLYSDDNWLDEIHHELRQAGRVALCIPASESTKVSVVLARLHTCPIEFDDMELHPRLVSVTHGLDQITCRIELSEALS